MSVYIVNAAIYIDAPTYEDFQEAFSANDFDEIEIIAISEPQETP